MPKPHISRTDCLAQEVMDQEAWVGNRGGSLPGYVAYYGSKDDIEYYGDGGEAIFLADAYALMRLRRLYRERTGQELSSGRLSYSTLALGAYQLGSNELGHYFSTLASRT